MKPEIETIAEAHCKKLAELIMTKDDPTILPALMLAFGIGVAYALNDKASLASTADWLDAQRLKASIAGSSH